MTVADYDQVFALWDNVEGMGLHPDEADSREGVARYLGRNPGTCFVARDGAKLIGAVLCGADGSQDLPSFSQKSPILVSHIRHFGAIPPLTGGEG